MAVDKKRKNTKAPASGPKRRKTQQQSKQTKRPVSVDALAWKTVDIPEMFDDAEGFFGLEEITGVDVVKEGDVVKFVSLVTHDGHDGAWINSHISTDDCCSQVKGGGRR